MSTYKSFAVVGYGHVGSLYVNEFQKSPQRNEHKLRVLTRSTAKPELKEIAAKGVEVVAVDYSSVPSITNALKGVDVVLSALRDDGLDAQFNVIRAAKAANVKLIVPSEYGRSTINNTYPYLQVKADTHPLLKELKLPYALFFTGMWPELLLTPSIGPYVGIDFQAGKFTLFGDGNPPQSWTSPRDFTRFIHHAVTTLPPSALENKVFEIEADRKSLRDIVRVWEAKHGKTAAVRELGPAETQRYVDEQTDAFFKFVPVVWQRGEMLVSGEANKLWPEWNPKKWQELVP